MTQAAIQPDPFWDYLDLLLFLLALAPAFLLAAGVTAGVNWLAGPLSRTLAALLLQFSLYGFWFAGLYAIFRVRHQQPFWESLAWGAPRRVMTRSLLAGPLLALAVGVLGKLLNTPDTQVPLMELLDSPMSIALVGFFAVTLGPLCEELAFRGFLLPLLRRSFGAAVAIVVAALPFALLHGPQYAWSWRHVLLIGLAGAVFGVVRHITGSTGAATLMHATYNLAFFTGFLATHGDKLPKW